MLQLRPAGVPVGPDHVQMSATLHADDVLGTAEPNGPTQDAAGAVSSPSQSLWILIFRGQPVDEPDTRTTQLYLSSDGRDDGNIGDTGVRFQLTGSRPNFEIHASIHRGSFWRRSDFVNHIFVAKVPTSSQEDMTWHNQVTRTRPTTEWDHQNWLDDVLQRLQGHSNWPRHDVDLQHVLKVMVDAICE